MSDSKKRDFNLLRLESDRFFLIGHKELTLEKSGSLGKKWPPLRGGGRESGKGEETRKLRSVVEQCQNTKRHLFPQ